MVNNVLVYIWSAFVLGFPAYIILLISFILFISFYFIHSIHLVHFIYFIYFIHFIHLFILFILFIFLFTFLYADLTSCSLFFSYFLFTFINADLTSRSLFFMPILLPVPFYLCRSYFLFTFLHVNFYFLFTFFLFFECLVLIMFMSHLDIIKKPFIINNWFILFCSNIWPIHIQLKGLILNFKGSLRRIMIMYWVVFLLNLEFL